MRSLLFISLAALSLSGCATIDRLTGNRLELTSCQTAQDLLRDSISAEILAKLTGKFINEAVAAREAAQANVSLACASVAPAPAPAESPPPEAPSN